MSDDSRSENSPDLQLEARIFDLLLDYKGYSPNVKNLITETGLHPYPPPNKFDNGAYIQLKVSIDHPDGIRFGEISAPTHPEDPNMRDRQFREDKVKQELLNPADPTIRDPKLLEHFQFPRLLAQATYNGENGREVPQSMMYEYVDTTPLGTVQLVTPGILTRGDMAFFSQFIRYIQRVGDNDRLAYNPLFAHRFMSYGPFDGNWTDDKPLFKWTRDLPGRDPVYRSMLKERGNEFADGISKLVDPDDLRILFTGEKVLAHGNFLWCNLGIVKNGVFRSKTMERANGQQTLESDNVAALSGLVSDEPLFNEFFVRSLEQNPTNLHLEHRRRSFLLDRFFGIVAMQKALENGSSELEKPVQFFVQQAFDALHRENLWDPSQYTFLTDKPLPLKY